MFNTDNCELLLKDDIKIYDKNKYDIYEKCLLHNNGVISSRKNAMKDKFNKQHLLNSKYTKLKKNLLSLEEKELTYSEEFNSNKQLIKFIVLENRIIFIVILLLIFLIYKYILK